MNTYEIRFALRCPVNGDLIAYTLTLESRRVLMVETLVREVRKVRRTPWLHESVADHFALLLPGRQTLRARHRSVEITTVRDGGDDE